jgi:hypothetical protein
MERRPLGLHAGNSSASRLAVLSGGTFFFDLFSINFDYSFYFYDNLVYYIIYLNIDLNFIIF